MVRARRIATVLQWVSDVPASSDWYRRFLGVEPTPYEGTYFKLDEGMLPDPRLGEDLVADGAAPVSGLRSTTS